MLHVFSAGSLSVLDPPEHLFRIRLVCILLDTCGQYFDRGSLKRKLDCFIVYFQVFRPRLLFYFFIALRFLCWLASVSYHYSTILGRTEAFCTTAEHYRTTPYYTIPLHSMPYHVIPNHATSPPHYVPNNTIPYHSLVFHTILYHTTNHCALTSIFQAYIWKKKSSGVWNEDCPFPKEVEYMVADTLESLRPKHKLHNSLEEAMKAVEALNLEYKQKIGNASILVKRSLV